MKALLVNASAPGYNLGLEKATNLWRAQGAAVEFAREVPALFLESHDAVWISAIFSWHVPGLISMAQWALDARKRVKVGGPGTFGTREHIRQKTGLPAQAHPDPRFEQQPGSYRMVFWSRGCPATHCSLGFPRDGGIPVCSVPQMEGRHFTLYEDVTPAPVILDNNLAGAWDEEGIHLIWRGSDRPKVWVPWLPDSGPADQPYLPTQRTNATSVGIIAPIVGP